MNLERGKKLEFRTNTLHDVDDSGQAGEEGGRQGGRGGRQSGRAKQGGSSSRGEGGMGGGKIKLSSYKPLRTKKAPTLIFCTRGARGVIAPLYRAKF